MSAWPPSGRSRNAGGRGRRHAAVVAAALVLAAVALAATAWSAAPAPRALEARVQARLHATGGTAVPLSEIAPILRDAVVATEDERFYRHHGIDLIGVIRAVPYDVLHASFAQGASTITEQLGKLVYLNGNDHNPWRKLLDAGLALKLEARYSKEQILDAYLNSVYFGEGAYGVSAAGRRYFGTAPSLLTTAQASLLAGLIQAPSADDPVTHPAAARARQVAVLRSLVRNGFLTEHEAAAAVAQPLRLNGAAPLAPIAGVDLSVGPAFVWRELLVGVLAAALGAAVLLISRLLRLGGVRIPLVVRVVSLLAVVLGTAVVVRSFRVV